MKKSDEKVVGRSAGVQRLSRSRRLARADDHRNPQETMDTLFQGELRLYQSRSGYRFSIDAILLAHFTAPGRADSVADLGAGNGVIGLILAHLHPSLRVTGFEIQSGMADAARRNARLNGLGDRVKIIDGDVRAIETIAARGSYGVVVCNPPYRNAESGRLSPDEEKKIARHQIEGTLDDFLRAGAYLLPVKGRITLVYLAAGLTELLHGLRHGGFEPKRLRMVHSYHDGEASSVLVEGVKGGRSGLKILAPLVIYETGKTYTAEVAALLAGRTGTSPPAENSSR